MGMGGYIYCICYSVHAALTGPPAGINFLLSHEIGGFTSHQTWQQTPLGTDTWWLRVYPSVFQMSMSQLSLFLPAVSVVAFA